MKKLCTLIAVIAAIAMLALSASAFTATVDGDTITLTVADGGDIDGVITVDFADGASFGRATGQNGVLAVFNPDNGALVLAGLGLEAGDSIVTIRVDGEGAVSFTGSGGQFEGATANATVGGSNIVDIPVIDDEPVEDEPAAADDTQNPKGGVALAIVPALVAAAAVAVTRKRK
ncbi:MAG: hypothetical protein FWD48_09455 [Oscillospiraceae bacterium]|nr:hypothetical protein [Oscillospiraceae bacterium]